MAVRTVSSLLAQPVFAGGVRTREVVRHKDAYRLCYIPPEFFDVSCAREIAASFRIVFPFFDRVVTHFGVNPYAFSRRMAHAFAMWGCRFPFAVPNRYASGPGRHAP
jgi:hypothetical protein